MMMEYNSGIDPPLVARSRVSTTGTTCERRENTGATLFCPSSVRLAGSSWHYELFSPVCATPNTTVDYAQADEHPGENLTPAKLPAHYMILTLSFHIYSQ